MDAQEFAKEQREQFEVEARLIVLNAKIDNLALTVSALNNKLNAVLDATTELLRSLST